KPAASSGHRSRSNDERSIRGTHQGQQSLRAASTGRTHDCKRRLHLADRILLQGGGHPHMRRRDLLENAVAMAALAPFGATAQQGLPIIGYLSNRSPEAEAPGRSAFLRELEQAGFAIGRNVAIEYRFAEGHRDRAPSLADELVRLPVAVLVATGVDSAV